MTDKRLTNKLRASALELVDNYAHRIRISRSQSSSIAMIAWNGPEQPLVVEFWRRKGGNKVYGYDAPESAWEALEEAAREGRSVGKAFHEHVTRAFLPYTLLGVREVWE